MNEMKMKELYFSFINVQIINIDYKYLMKY